MSSRSGLKRFISSAVSVGDGAHDCWNRMRGQTTPGSAVVLYYHEIGRSDRERFARQMDEVLKQAHAIPTSFRGELVPGGRSVAISFDDGFVSVMENAWPELKARKIPTTLFVPTGYLGQRPGWVKDPQYRSYNETILSASELRGLGDEPLLTIASHSIHHPNFGRISPEEAWVELTNSKQTLEEITRRPVEEFSFPHGAHRSDSIELARRAGYRRIFTVQPRLAFRTPDEFVTGRVLADPSDSIADFRLKVCGAYRWMPWVSQVKSKLRGSG